LVFGGLLYIKPKTEKVAQHLKASDGL
jgi:hypothetical protein